MSSSDFTDSYLQQHSFLVTPPATHSNIPMANSSSFQPLYQPDKRDAMVFDKPPSNEFSFYVNLVVIPLLLSFGAVGNLVSLVVLFYRPSSRSRWSSTSLARYRHHIPLQYPILAGLDQAVPPVTLPWFVNGGPASFGRHHRRRRSIQPLERVAMIGLGCLAVSDLAFCLVGVPAGLLALTYGGWSSKVGQFYRVYRQPLHNTFLLSSTWITVCVAVERFFAVMKPLRARWTLKVSSV